MTFLSQQVSDQLASLRREASDVLKDQRAYLKEARIALGVGALTVSLPTGLAYAAVHAGVPPLWAAAMTVTGITLALVNLFGRWRGDTRKVRSTTPWQYLISMEGQFGSAPAEPSPEETLRKMLKRPARRRSPRK